MWRRSTSGQGTSRPPNRNWCTKMDRTVRHLGVDIEDTLTLSKGIDL